jgi:hypothetical protein
MDDTGRRSLSAAFFNHPDMIQYEDRLQSFMNWSKQLIPDKYAMAQAGFLYTGQSDVVQCFGCNIRVSQWEKTDNPWSEHLKWSPDCVFLKLIGYGTQPNVEPTIESRASEVCQVPQHKPVEVSTHPYHNGFDFRTGPDQTLQSKPTHKPMEVTSQPYHNGFNFQSKPPAALAFPGFKGSEVTARSKLFMGAGTDSTRGRGFNSFNR